MMTLNVKFANPAIVMSPNYDVWSDFTGHLLCVPLPTIVKHKCHIDPLCLQDYFVEDDYEEYYCKIEHNSCLGMCLSLCRMQ